MNSEAIKNLRNALTVFGFDGAISIPGPTLQYLTGHSFHLMERPVFLMLSVEQDPVLVLPELEAVRIRDDKLYQQVVPYGEADASRDNALKAAVDMIGTSSLKMAIEPLRMRYFELDLLRSAAPDWKLEAGSELFTSLRVHKDESEIKHMQRAVEVAEAALQNTLPLVKIGMTERELAAELVVQLFRAGSEPELPFSPIVASGPNSALPHATPTDRELTAGDLLILDWGASASGYISDITRTFAVGEVDPDFEHIHDVVVEANAAGRAAVEPGVTCDEVDRATRAVIAAAGYGDQFIHRTGHGIGLEPHEPPNIRSGEMYPLEAGMTFTIEPGIYLTDRGGVRIEDNVQVTHEGVRTLTSLSRALDVLG